MDQEINVIKSNTKNITSNLRKIFIDNQQIDELNLSSLRKEISIVDQNITLFDDTVFNNIKYANPKASNEDVIKAAESSECIDFIKILKTILKLKSEKTG